MQRPVGQCMGRAIGQQRDVGCQPSHEKVVSHHARLLCCSQQMGADVVLCVGGAGATKLVEFLVEKCIKTGCVPAHRRLVQLHLKCLKLAEK